MSLNQVSRFVPLAMTMLSNSIKPPASAHRRIPVIGIIGGIGSGKSAVARWVAERANVAVIDADQLGHQALRFDTVKSALRQRFGQSIFDEQGEVRRSELATHVFGNGDQQRLAKLDLEQIVHPAIEQQIVDAIAAAEREQRDAVLLDAAVLLEAGWQNRCDAVVFVDAPDEVRHRRVAARNGWSLEELRRRESSQMGLAEKQQQCNFVISNASDDSKGGQELLDFLWG